MRVTRYLSAALVASALGTPAVAAAISPPPVDDSLTPRAAPPAPPTRTEQHQDCITTSDRAPDDVRPVVAGLPQIWRLTRGGGQTVAVIDTGVAPHRLLPHLVAGGDYVSTGDGTEDCDGHGTVVAGIIGAAPESGVFSGVAPDATIVGIRQSSTRFRAADDVSGFGYGDVETLAMAVRTAADLGATVINVSSVACLPADAVLNDRTLGAALSYAVDVKNVVVVTAAGNVGGQGQCPDQNPARPGVPNWTDVNVVVSPAWYDEYVLTVGSVDHDGRPSQFSLAGPWVDVAAPGEDVVSLDPDGEGLIDSLPTPAGPMPISGTSYSAPVVSGVVALLRAHSPELTARQVMARIEDTALAPAAGWDPVVGHGVVDALAAVTGGPARPPVQHRQPVSAAPAAPQAERHSGRLSIGLAAASVALSVGLVAAASSANRLRRRSDAVAHD
ncbi:type VII secretion-associated serine protease mycosin [Mycolicibacterium sp. XJ1819]